MALGNSAGKAQWIERVSTAAAALRVGHGFAAEYAVAGAYEKDSQPVVRLMLKSKQQRRCGPGKSKGAAQHEVCSCFSEPYAL